MSKKKVVTSAPAKAMPHKAQAKPEQTQSRQFLKVMLGCITIACVAFAILGPILNHMRSRAGLVAPAGPIDSREFLAVLYQRSQATDAENIDPERLTAHVEMLSANGYQPITLQQVNNLLKNEAMLPRNAILVVVDGNDAELLKTFESVARKIRWGGVALVATAPLDQNNPGATTWKDLQTLLKTKRWTIATQGHIGANMLPADEKGSMQHHLITRQWIPSQNRHESLEEFAARIMNDQENAAAVTQRKLQLIPDTFVFPSSATQIILTAKDPESSFHARAVARLYEQAFIPSPLARNTIHTDPRRLNLMPVNPNWTSQLLLDNVQMAGIRVENVEEASTETIAAGWMIDKGTLKPELDGLTLTATAPSQDAKIWLAGSDQLSDLHARFRIRKAHAALQFDLMTQPEQQNGLKLNFAPGGNITLYQTNKQTAQNTILAQGYAVLLDNTEHLIEIFMRHNSLEVHADGESIFRHAVHIPARERNQGLIGISMLPQEGNKDAFAKIHHASVKRPIPLLVSWNMDATYQDYVIDHVHRHGAMLSNLSPPFRLPGGTDSESQELFQKLANVYGISLTPKLNISSAEDFRNWTPDMLLRALSEQRSDGIYVSFAEHNDLTVPELDNWVQQVSRSLSSAGQSLLIRLPRVLDRLAAVNAILAVVPTVQIVTGTGSQTSSTSSMRQTVEEQPIAQPTNENMQNLPQIFTITETRLQEQGGIQEQIQMIAAEAEEAYSRGAYEAAIAHFTTWHELAPASPAPLQRIGDALTNLGYRDEAVSFYRQSLDIAPDNIQLAIQLARLLTATDSHAQARSLLNIYARLFPRNTEILLAQAEWLLRNNRRNEAIERIKRVREIDPDNFNAVLFSLQLAEQDEGQSQAIEELMRLSTGHGDDGQRRLIQAIRDYNLLTLQHAYRLVGFLQQNRENIEDPETLDMLTSLEPLTTTVEERFEAGIGLSDNWIIDGMSATLTNNTLKLQANPTRSQAEARLSRAERWRDSFIEIDLASVNGGFWMHARKSNRQLVRLGFEPAQERLHLQIWGGPLFEAIDNQFIPWTIPETGATLRLEVRGNGAIAYINGKALLEAPIAIPEDFGFGWTSFAINQPARGQASLAIRRIASGPIPVRAAVVPTAPPNDDGKMLDRLHKILPQISDISPDWFRVGADGKWQSQIAPEDDFYRIFARYYRLRLTPLVRIERGATIQPDDIIILARTHGYNGMTLLFDVMPDSDWFDTMNGALNVPGLDVITVAQTGGGITSPSVRGIAGSSTLFPRAHAASPIQLIQYTDEEADPIAPRLVEPTPALIFLQ